MASHNQGEKCQRSMLWSAGGGKELTERRLKQWCLGGFGVGVDSKSAHGELPRYLPEEDLPSLAALHAFEVPAEHEEEISEVLLRRPVHVPITG